MSPKPFSASQSVSRSVNVMSPRKPRFQSSTDRISDLQRSDLVATRIGFPRARRSRSSAFAHIASRSTNANGGSRPESAAS